MLRPCDGPAIPLYAKVPCSTPVGVHLLMLCFLLPTLLATPVAAQQPPDCNMNNVEATVVPVVNGIPVPAGAFVVPAQEITYRITLLTPSNAPMETFCDVQGGQLAMIFPNWQNIPMGGPPAPGQFVEVAGYAGTPSIPQFGNGSPTPSFQIDTPVLYVAEEGDADADGNLNARAEYGDSSFIQFIGLNQVNGTFLSAVPDPTAMASALDILPIRIPEIDIEKTADPSTICEGTPTEINYTYTVSNPSEVDLANVIVSDADCPPMFVGGDDNGNGFLNPGESWIYTCTATVSTTTTNQAIASAVAFNLGRLIECCPYTDIDTATVTAVGRPTCTIEVPDPLPLCASMGNMLAATVLGGTPPFTFDWQLSGLGWQITAGQDSDTVTYDTGGPATMGAFTLSVTDNLGCVTGCEAVFGCLEVTCPEIEIDKQVSCDGGVTFVDVGFGDGVAVGCNGWNAYDGNAAEPVMLRYLARYSQGSAAPQLCELTDSNSAIIPASLPVDFDASPEVVGDGIGDDDGVCEVDEICEIHTTAAPCSDELDLLEPDTATLTCQCVVNDMNIEQLEDSDQADFECLTPGLGVVKECTDNEPLDGDNDITITVSNTGEADLENCQVTDAIFLDDPTCPADIPPGTPIVVAPAMFDLPAGGMPVEATATTGVLAEDACNTASVTCDITGTDKQITAGDDDLCFTLPGCPQLQVDKQVSCDGGLTFVDVGFADGVAESCDGWNAYEGNAAEDVIVRYVAQSVAGGGGVDLSNCLLSDSNTGLLPTPVPIAAIPPAPGATIFEVTVPCSEVLDDLEPDTATLTCDCVDNGSVIGQTSDTDQAAFDCQTPELQVIKICENDGDVMIAANNVGDADLENCVLIDEIFLEDALCPADFGPGTPVPVTPDNFDLAAGEAIMATGSVGFMLFDACNMATLTCDIAGTDKQISAVDEALCIGQGVALECRVTGGGNINQTFEGGNRFTWGGQAGAPTAAQPQPCGEWTHRQHVGPGGKWTFHAGTASAPPGTEIDSVACCDPGFCDPGRPAPAKQITFNGLGTFKNIHDLPDQLPPGWPAPQAGESFHWFEVHVEDLGEPGSQQPDENAICPEDGFNCDLGDCGCLDFYRFTLHIGPDAGSPVMYEVFGYLDGGGNHQVHPPISGNHNCHAVPNNDFPHSIPLMYGDFNGDAVTNAGDLSMLLCAWGACDGCGPDLTWDGLVNHSDLAVLLSLWDY